MSSGQDATGLLWYAIRVASNYERFAAQALQGKNLEAFLPLYSCWRSWNGGLRTVERALFPGYVFGRFDLHNRLPVLTIPGVVHIVGAGKMPVPVDDQELDAVRRLLASRLPVEPWPFVKVGERVWIERGPLRGLEGIVLNFRGSYRLIVSVTLLQRSVAAEIDRESVRPIPTAIRPVEVRFGLQMATAIR